MPEATVLTCRLDRVALLASALPVPPIPELPEVALMRDDVIHLVRSRDTARMSVNHDWPIRHQPQPFTQRILTQEAQPRRTPTR